MGWMKAQQYADKERPAPAFKEIALGWAHKHGWSDSIRDRFESYMRFMWDDNHKETEERLAGFAYHQLIEEGRINAASGEGHRDQA